MLTDQEFTDAFEGCTLPIDQFHHRDHLRLAWIYVRSYGPAKATVRIAESIQRYAAYHGKSSKYDRKLTVAWMRLVAEAVIRAPEASFEELLAAFPALLDKSTTT
jgi:hypothetical protein